MVESIAAGFFFFFLGGGGVRDAVIGVCRRIEGHVLRFFFRKYPNKKWDEKIASVCR